MANSQSIKCEMCGKEMLPEETLVIEEGKGLLDCDKCAWEHNKASWWNDVEHWHTICCSMYPEWEKKHRRAIYRRRQTARKEKVGVNNYVFDYAAILKSTIFVLVYHRKHRPFEALNAWLVRHPAASASCSEEIVTATVITTTPNIASADTIAITANVVWLFISYFD